MRLVNTTYYTDFSNNITDVNGITTSITTSISTSITTSITIIVSGSDPKLGY